MTGGGGGGEMRIWETRGKKKPNGRKVNREKPACPSRARTEIILNGRFLCDYRSLRCARNTLHTHMFTSFAINNLLWLLWYRLVIEHPTVVVHNGVCKNNVTFRRYCAYQFDPRMGSHNAAGRTYLNVRRQ